MYIQCLSSHVHVLEKKNKNYWIHGNRKTDKKNTNKKLANYWQSVSDQIIYGSDGQHYQGDDLTLLDGQAKVGSETGSE